MLGLPAYRSEDVIRTTIDSLLAQDFTDFAIVVADDHSPDRTFEAAEELAHTDARVTVVQNPQRRGMWGNYNGVFEHACALYPDHELFAWASDNDLRHRAWLSTLVRALDEQPQAVLAYGWDPSHGDTVEVPGDSRGVADPLRRFRIALERVPAAILIFGLQRREALERIGGIPPTLVPDSLYLAELSLHGTFVGVRKARWRRGARKTGGSRRKQRRAVFAGRSPLLSYAPVGVQHLARLFRVLVLGNRERAGVSRVDGMKAVVLYAVARSRRVGTKLRGQWARSIRRRRQELRTDLRSARKRSRFRRKRLRNRLARRFESSPLVRNALRGSLAAPRKERAGEARR